MPDNFRFEFDRLLEEKYSVIYKATEVVFWEGDEAKYFYVILEGLVEVRKRLEDGNNFSLSVLKPGDFFGEMALLNDLPRSGTAVAKERTKLLAFSQAQLESVLVANPKFAMKMIRVLCERVRKLSDILEKR